MRPRQTKIPALGALTIWRRAQTRNRMNEVNSGYACRGQDVQERGRGRWHASGRGPQCLRGCQGASVRAAISTEGEGWAPAWSSRGQRTEGAVGDPVLRPGRPRSEPDRAGREGKGQTQLHPGAAVNVGDPQGALLPASQTPVAGAKRAVTNCGNGKCFPSGISGREKLCTGPTY